MESIGRGLMFAGAMIFILGGLIYLVAKVGFPIGRLPGDVRLGGENFTCLIPLATSLLLSIILTLLLNLAIRYLNR